MDRMFLLRFFGAAVPLTVFVTLSMHDALEAGWFWKLNQANRADHAQRLFPGTTHFFEVGKHWGLWVAIPLNLVLAWAYAQSAPMWNAQVQLIAMLLSSILALLAMRSWAIADNDPNPAKHVLSGFAQNGSFTTSGLCMTFTMTFTYTIAVMFFVSPGTADPLFPLIFAIALTVALVIGLIQPPLYVWGNIHSAAWAQSAFFTVFVWALYFAHKYGFVVPT
jgi:hypothetical protein